MTKQQPEALHQDGEPQKELMQKLCENSTAQLWLSYCDKKMECEDLREDLDAAKARIAELEAELPATSPTQQGLEQDAARYRWLRATTNTATNSRGERIDVRNQPEVWDKAIDAAIAAQAKQEPKP